MDDEDLSLSPEESGLLRSSHDPTSIRRRLRAVVISGALLAVVLLVTSPLIQSWEFLLFFAVAYIGVSTWERIRCARTILAYESLVRKITERGDRS